MRTHAITTFATSSAFRPQLGVRRSPATSPTAAAQSIAEFKLQREKMVRDEVHGAGVKNERVLESMRKTPRHEFVNFRDRPYAYFDMALPIGEGQTISPPFIVAYMTEQLDPQPTDKVLEIGTGSGYQAAVLSPLVKEVYTIEIVEPLGRQAAARAAEAASTRTSSPRSATATWAGPRTRRSTRSSSPARRKKCRSRSSISSREGGRMIVPVGERYQQMFYLFAKKDGKLVSEALRPTLFVPMTGKAETLREVKPDPRTRRSSTAASKSRTWRTRRKCRRVGTTCGKRRSWPTTRTRPKGSNIIVFKNETPGRGCQALQGFAVDGSA